MSFHILIFGGYFTKTHEPKYTYCLGRTRGQDYRCLDTPLYLPVGHIGLRIPYFTPGCEKSFEYTMGRARDPSPASLTTKMLVSTLELSLACPLCASINMSVPSTWWYRYGYILL